MAYGRGKRVAKGPDGKYRILGASGDVIIDWAMNGSPIYALDEYEQPICYAFLPGKNLRRPHAQRCYGTPVCPVTGRCAIHSRLIPERVKQYRGLRMAKVLPTSMQADFERLASDPGYLSVKEDVHILDMRLEQLYAQLQDAADPEIWQALKQEAKKLEAAMAGNWVENPASFARICRDIICIVGQGGKEGKIWEEIISTTEAKARLQKQEMNFLVTQAGMATKEQVAAMTTMLVRAVKEELALALPGRKGEEVADNIAERIAEYMTGAPSRPQITVIDGLPLMPIDVSDGKTINGARMPRKF